MCLTALESSRGNKCLSSLHLVHSFLSVQKAGGVIYAVVSLA